MLARGMLAPGFSLVSGADKIVELEDYKNNKKVVLIFYPFDWSPVCGDELSIFNLSLKLLEEYNAVPIGISVDSKWSHKAFTEYKNLHFDLLSDFQPRGEVATKYEVFDEKEGRAKRGLYIIDEKGLVRWTYLSSDGENPGVNIVLDALEEIAVEDQK